MTTRAAQRSKSTYRRKRRPWSSSRRDKYIKCSSPTGVSGRAQTMRMTRLRLRRHHGLHHHAHHHYHFQSRHPRSLQNPHISPQSRMMRLISPDKNPHMTLATRLRTGNAAATCPNPSQLSSRAGSSRTAPILTPLKKKRTGSSKRPDSRWTRSVTGSLMLADVSCPWSLSRLQPTSTSRLNTTASVVESLHPRTAAPNNKLDVSARCNSAESDRQQRPNSTTLTV